MSEQKYLGVDLGDGTAVVVQTVRSGSAPEQTSHERAIIKLITELTAANETIRKLREAATKALVAIGDYGVSKSESPQAIAYLWDRQEAAGKNLDGRMQEAFESLQAALVLTDPNPAKEG